MGELKKLQRQRNLIIINDIIEGKKPTGEPYSEIMVSKNYDDFDVDVY